MNMLRASCINNFGAASWRIMRPALFAWIDQCHTWPHSINKLDGLTPADEAVVYLKLILSQTDRVVAV